MIKEELFFKENYPEYVTEKGECLSPYWDLFSAGVICATFELNNEIAELKAYNEKLLDGDIEKHNKIAELKEQVDALANVNIKAQNIIGKAKDLIRNLLRVTYDEGWNYSLDWKVKAELKAEQFLREIEK